MSDNKKVNDLLNVTMDKVKEMVDVDTIIGDPISTPDGTTIIPVSRVSYGFAAGGSDLPSKAQPPAGLFGGGSGVGVTVIPIAFLAISNGNVRVLQIEPYMGPLDRALEKMPDVVDKITALFSKNRTEEAPTHSAETKEEPAPEA